MKHKKYNGMQIHTKISTWDNFSGGNLTLIRLSKFNSFKTETVRFAGDETVASSTLPTGKFSSANVSSSLSLILPTDTNTENRRLDYPQVTYTAKEILSFSHQI
jgi:hypothetical protein